MRGHQKVFDERRRRTMNTGRRRGTRPLIRGVVAVAANSQHERLTVNCPPIEGTGERAE